MNNIELVKQALITGVVSETKLLKQYFKDKNLSSDETKEILRQNGYKLSDNYEVEVLFNDNDDFYFVIPYNDREIDPSEVYAIAAAKAAPNSHAKSISSAGSISTFVGTAGTASSASSKSYYDVWLGAGGSRSGLPRPEDIPHDNDTPNLG